MDKKNNKHIKVTPENFCYLSDCKYFVSDILSTGCRLDYMTEDEIIEEEAVCALDLERNLRADDEDWQKEENPLEALSEMYEKIDDEDLQDWEVFKDEEVLLRQIVQDLKIELEKAKYELQDFIETQEIKTKNKGD